MIAKKTLGVSAIALSLALVLSGCAAEEETTSTDTGSTDTGSASTTETTTELTGSVVIDGSSTVGPAIEVAAELFMERNPGVRVSVNISGTGGGFEKFCNGETDGSNASRPIKDSEAEACKAADVGYEFVTVANDALSVVVNIDNPLTCITVAQLKQMWEFDTSADVWGDIDGLDLPAAFLTEPINLYGPGTDSGTFDYFTEEINGESGNIRLDYTNIGEDDDLAVLGVEGSVGAVGFIPYSYYQESQDKVKGLAIDDGTGCVEPTLENVQNLSYTPLGRGLFSYVSSTAIVRPEVQALYRFFVEETELINTTAGFVGLTAAQQTEQLAAIEALLG